MIIEKHPTNPPATSTVDVIVPCYNYGRYLRQCVESVLAQEGVEVRVLIIDDASTDDTSEVARTIADKDSRVTVVRHATNKGHIATYNEGIDWISAKYYLLLSADDYLLQDALRRSAEFLDSHPTVGFCYGRAVDSIENETPSFIEGIRRAAYPFRWRILKGLDFIEQSAWDNVVRTPTAVVRVDLQKQMSGYNAHLPHTADLELWLRLADRASVGIIDECQAVYRRHHQNMSITYAVDGWLPDLRQRKHAFDIFLSTYSNNHLDVLTLRSNIMRSLSRRAISAASSAFNEGKLDTSHRLMMFALEICPQIKRSFAALKYVCKCSVGYRVWTALRPMFTGRRAI